MPDLEAMAMTTPPPDVLEKIKECLQSAKSFHRIHDLLLSLSIPQVAHLLVDEDIWVDFDQIQRNAMSRFIPLAKDEDWLWLLKELLRNLTVKLRLKVITQLDKKGNNALHYAAIAGNDALCDTFLQGLIDAEDKRNTVSHRNNTGQNVIHLAAGQSNSTLLNRVLEPLDAELESRLIMQTDTENHTAVHYVVKKGTYDMLERLLKWISLGERQSIAMKVAPTAVKMNREPLVNILLSELTPEQVADVMSNRSIENEILEGSVGDEMLEGSIEKREILESSNNLITPLQMAIQQDNTTMLKMLLKPLEEPYGMRLLKQTSQSGVDILRFSIDHGNPLVLEMILELIPPTELENVLAKKNAVGDNVVHQAASLGKTEILKLLLAKLKVRERLNILNQQTLEGYNAAHIAIKRGGLKVFQIMVEMLEKRDIPGLLFQRDNAGDSVIHLAIRYSRESILRAIWGTLEAGPLGDDILLQNHQGDNLIHEAAKLGNSDVICAVLKLYPEKGLRNINEVFNEDGNNVFHLALIYQNGDLIKQFLDCCSQETVAEKACSDVNRSGYNVFHLAAQRGDVCSMEMLLDLLNQQQQLVAFSQRSSGGNQILHLAAKQRCQKMLEKLLNIEKFKVAPDHIQEKNADCRNVVHVSVYQGVPDLVNTILHPLDERQAEKIIADKDREGNNALHVAIQERYYLIAKALLPKLLLGDHENLIGDQNDAGNNSIHLAAKQCNVELLKLLLSLTPDGKQRLTRVENHNGETPIFAALNNQIEILLDLAMTGGLRKQEREELQHKFEEVWSIICSASNIDEQQKKEYVIAESLYQIILPEQRLAETIRLIGLWAAINNQPSCLKLPGVFQTYDTGLVSSPLHVTVMQDNTSLLAELLDHVPKHQIFDHVKQQNGQGYNVVNLAAKQKRPDMLKTLLEGLSPTELVFVMTQKNRCEKSALDHWEGKCPTILDIIPKSKLAGTTSKLLQYAISENNTKVLKFLVQTQRHMMKERIPQLLQNLPLTQGQIAILSPLSTYYIIPTDQSASSCVSLIFHESRNEQECKNWRYLHKIMSSFGFQTEVVEWTDVSELTLKIVSEISTKASQCSLLWITVIGDVGIGKVLGDIKERLTSHPAIPLVIYLHTPDNSSNEELPSLQSYRPHTVLLRSTSMQDNSAERPYMEVLAEEIGRADGVKDIHSMHMSAILEMSPDDSSPIPEYSGSLRKLLALPHSIKKVITKSRRRTDKLKLSMPDSPPIPTTLLNALSSLCRERSVQYAIFSPDPDDSEHILVQGINATNISPADLAKVIGKEHFRITLQNSSGKLHTELLALEPMLKIRKDEWGNEGWESDNSTQASCELLVNAIETRKVGNKEKRSTYSVGPAHMAIIESDRELCFSNETMKIARQNVEMMSTSNRYIMQLGKKEVVKFDLCHPPLMCYRYWCTLSVDRPSCEACKAFKSLLNQIPLNATAAQTEYDDLKICEHLTLSDAIFLLLNKPAVEQLSAALASSITYDVGEIYKVETIRELKVICGNKLEIVIGTYKGYLLSFEMSPPSDGYFFGLHLLFTLTSTEVDGTPHKLTAGDCGHIVFLDHGGNCLDPIGMFIGTSRSAFSKPTYRAILLDQMITEMESDYSHHVQEVQLLNQIEE